MIVLFIYKRRKNVSYNPDYQSHPPEEQKKNLFKSYPAIPSGDNHPLILSFKSIRRTVRDYGADSFPIIERFEQAAILKKTKDFRKFFLIILTDILANVNGFNGPFCELSINHPSFINDFSLITVKKRQV